MRLAQLPIIYITYLLVTGFLALCKAGGGVEITVLDIGQGDSILIKTVHNHLILIDGGDGWDVDSHLPNGLPGSSCVIDLMILTHNHKDHSYGLKRVLERCKVRSYWTYPGTFAGKKASVDGLKIEVLWPPPNMIFDDVNNTSLITLITYRNFEGLFTGDADGEVICSLEKLPDEPDLLKVSHHGSITGLCEDVIPKTAVISVGKENKFGHPSEQVLNFYYKNGVKVHRTDLNGEYKLKIPL